MRPSRWCMSHRVPGTARGHSDLVELEVLEGLAGAVVGEARSIGARVIGQSETSVQVATSADRAGILAMRTPVAAYLVRRFDVPRPRALLGEEHLRSLIDQ